MDESLWCSGALLPCLLLGQSWGCCLPHQKSDVLVSLGASRHNPKGAEAYHVPHFKGCSSRRNGSLLSNDYWGQMIKFFFFLTLLMICLFSIWDWHAEIHAGPKGPDLAPERAVEASSRGNLKHPLCSCFLTLNFQIKEEH